MKYNATQYIDETAENKLLKRVIGLNDKYSTQWIRFKDYEIKETESGDLYIHPVSATNFELYNPFDTAEQLVVDTLRLGDAYASYIDEMKEVHLNAYRKRKTNKMWSELKEQIIEYATLYGLLGFMSSSTYNRNVIGDKEILITERNNLNLKSRIISGTDYLKMFTPFVQKGDIGVKEYKNSVYFVKYEDTPRFYGKRPPVMDLIFSGFYAENIKWILDYALMLSKHYDQLSTYRKSSATLTEPVTILADQFEATKIGFTVTQDKETKISWDFDSLKTTVQTIYAFALTDENSTLKRCEHCKGFYIANSSKEKYCGSACRNRHNVMKSRERMKNEDSHIE